MNSVDLDEVATTVRFAELVGVTQQAISKQIAKGMLQKGETYGEWLQQYAAHLRELAAGRGGDHQVALSEAKAEDARASSALKRLTYHKEIKTLIPAHDAESALSDWAGYAVRETDNTFETIITTIEEAHGIKIEGEKIDSSITALRGRIIGYAENLAERLTEDEAET